MSGRLEFEGTDVDGIADDPGEAGATLIGGQGFPVASTARALLPASMAGLSGSSAMVWVGPPLSARAVSSPGSATPTWFPLTPSIRPPEPPVPIRLYAPETEPSPSCEMSLGVVPSDV